MLDLHTHILPEVDDGSRSLEQSLAMLMREAEQGMDTVILTPHYEARLESPTEFVRRRSAAENLLRTETALDASFPQLRTGAEVFFFVGLSRMEELEALCIDGTRCMLVEMPFCAWSRHMLDELQMLQQMRGVQPILAHVERYRSYQPTSLFRELSEGGMWLQSNASFFLQWQTKRQAMAMLRQRLISFVASDCHGLERRPPNLGEALEKIEKKLGREAMTFLKRNEDLLLEGGT